MRANPLYTFITTYLQQLPPEVIELLQKNSQTYDTPYCLLNLTLEHTPNYYDRYYLVGHHVSFYKTFDPKNPLLSECHYTGYFIDAEENRYQLHVYFDAKGTLLRAPLFQSLEENLRLSLLFTQQFIQLATQKTQSLLSQLHIRIEEKLTEFTQTYERLDESCKEFKVENLETLSQYLEKIIEISSQKTASLYIARKKLITQLLQTLKNSATTPASVIARDTEETQDEATFLDNSALSTKKAPVMPPFSSVDLEKIKKEYGEALKETAPLQKAIKLNTVLQDIYVEQLSDQQKTDTLQGLYKLERLVFKAGKQFFITLLENNQFDIAEQMSCFHSLLCLNNLERALETKNVDYLRFLLKKGDFNLDTQSLTIDEKTQHSAITYCIEQAGKTKHTLETMSKIRECFALMIEQGADLLSTTPEGIPVAHLILSDTTHALYDCLQSSAIVKNYTFFKKMKKIIHALLLKEEALQAPSPTELEPFTLSAESDTTFTLCRPETLISPSQLTSETKISLTQALESYLSDNALQSLENNPNKNNIHALEAQLIEKLKKRSLFLSTEDTENNHEVIALLEKTTQLIEQFVRALKNSKSTTAIQNELNKTCDADPMLPPQSPENILRYRRNFLHNTNRILLLKIELLTLAEKKQTHKISKKIEKKQNEIKNICYLQDPKPAPLQEPAALLTFSASTSSNEPPLSKRAQKLLNRQNLQSKKDEQQNKTLLAELDHMREMMSVVPITNRMNALANILGKNKPQTQYEMILYTFSQNNNSDGTDKPTLTEAELRELKTILMAKYPLGLPKDITETLWLCGIELSMATALNPY